MASLMMCLAVSLTISMVLVNGAQGQEKLGCSQNSEDLIQRCKEKVQSSVPPTDAYKPDPKGCVIVCVYKNGPAEINIRICSRDGTPCGHDLRGVCREQLIQCKCVYGPLLA